MGDNKRLSLGYVLGWGAQPFKERKSAPPPKPPQPNPIVKMVTTPGLLMEYIASDGRKGALSKTGKVSLTRGPLTAFNLAKVPSEKLPGKTPSTVAKAAKSAAPVEVSAPAAVDEVDWGAGLGAMFGDGVTAAAEPATTTANPTWGDNYVAQKDKTAEGNKINGPDGFSTEEDAELMRRKNEGESWKDIAAGMNKEQHALKKRFGIIKPADWTQPKPASKQNHKGGKGKHKQEEKTDETTSGATANWNNGGNDNSGGAGDGGWISTAENGFGGAWNDTSGDKAEGGWEKSGDTVGDWNKPGDNAAGGWDDTGGNAGGGWNNGENVGGDNNPTWGADGGFDTGFDGGFETSNPFADTNAVTTWDNNDPKPSSDDEGKGNTKPASHKSKPNSKSNKPSSNWNAPTAAARAAPSVHSVAESTNSVRTLVPDDTFSYKDLVLLSKIMREDASMLWIRVASRFRDKTGRIMHPAEFEEKITGSVVKKRKERVREV